MAAASVTASTVQFVWTPDNVKDVGRVQFPVPVPSRLCAAELASIIAERHALPPFCRPGLIAALEAFIRRETAAYHARHFEADLAVLTAGGPEMLEHLVDQSEAAFAEPGSASPGAESRGQGYCSDEMLFAHAYHSLILSNALHTLLSLERQCSRAVGSLIDERDRDLESLERQQQSAMEAAIAQAGSRFSDEAISRMAQQQWEAKQLLEGRFASELEHVKTGQRREYRDFVLSVHERAETMEEDLSEYIRPAILGDFEDDSEAAVGDETSGDGFEANGDGAPWEESFTIVLGKQLKTSHHFRLLRADILDFCRPRRRPGTAERLNTAMTLYADRLSGLVLLVDNRLNAYSGIKREFARVCERATEFHFPELQEQFDRISLVNQSASERRAAGGGNGGLPASSSAPVTRFKSPPSLDSDLSCQADEACSLRSWTSFDSSPRLQVGDVYVTRHSNLTEAHVVFHLVVDDTVFDANLSSVSPIIRGLANIFRVCFQHDVVKLTLPLLLAHYTCEEMTASWCTRRVDMVYKAVKAGIIEGSTWLSHESRLIQFAVPPGLSDEMLESFRDQLPSVFHLANPVKG